MKLTKLRSSSSSNSRSLIKFTEKHDKNYETDNKAHTQAPRMYTHMHPNILNGENN